MTCPSIGRIEAEAALARSREDVLAALRPVMEKHGLQLTVIGTSHVLGEIIGVANAHAQLGGPVSEQMVAVRNMVAAGVHLGTRAILPPEGRA
jgi:ribosomal protein L7Ae-like RNA K-turn-binding protein